MLDPAYRSVKKTQGKKILDVGFGTGVLSKILYDEGYEIHGIDFSEKMIQLAIWHNFLNGFPDELSGGSYDCIISTYAIHHLNDNQKVDLFHA